jgi:predicted dehydrogenase
MTWLMKGKMPVSVTAITKRIQPTAYPKVDDEATILVEYADATGIIEASCYWPFGIIDFEVFGTTAYILALVNHRLVRKDRGKNTYDAVTEKPPVYQHNLIYLAKVLRGEVNPANDLSSMENNLVVVKILEAAGRSAKEGRRIAF